MFTFERVDDRVVVDVWSDVVCPFCYIGDAVLAQAVEQFSQRVDVRYHSYQLMPELPVGEVVDLPALMERRRGIPREQFAAMNEQVASRAAQVGLTYNLDRAQTTNTLAAHRLSHLAKAKGKQHEVVERLFRAYFTDGLNIGDEETLADLAVAAGLERDEALAALRSGAYGEDVQADITTAGELGIRGVPFFVLDGAYAVSGAQPVEVFLNALNTAWGAKSEGVAAPA